MNIPPGMALQPNRPRAFSILELLSVMAIVVTLSAVALPALNSIKGGSSVNRAVADLSGTLELARTYAMANRTHVRVLFSHVPAGNGRLGASTIALPVSSADGASGPATDMMDSTKWPSLSKPLVLEDLKILDTLEGRLPIDTSNDATPMGANVQGSFMAPLARAVPGRGQVSFTGVVQFGPTGEARVCFDEPSRYIKIALDRPLSEGAAEGLKRNPFILRLSGVNGAISVLRAEDVAL